MVSCVASVEFQLKVADSPLLMEVGLACSVTVGVAGAGAAGLVSGGLGWGLGLHPTVKTAAASITNKPARKGEREARFMRILLSEVPVFVPPERLS
jgi:hypothetical protein